MPYNGTQTLEFLIGEKGMGKGGRGLLKMGVAEERRGERNRQIEKERERGKMGGRQGTSKEQYSYCAHYSHRCLTEFPLSIKK